MPQLTRRRTAAAGQPNSSVLRPAENVPPAKRARIQSSNDESSNENEDIQEASNCGVQNADLSDQVSEAQPNEHNRINHENQPPTRPRSTRRESGRSNSSVSRPAENVPPAKRARIQSSNDESSTEEEDMEGEPLNFGVQNSDMSSQIPLQQLDDRLRVYHESQAPRPLSIDGEPGHIKEIILHNFMCHENFTVKLGPRINFIIGPNGSGKSAILSAIVLGLGARASNTNRASGLNSFIKTGQTKAKITIKLCNYFNNQNRGDAFLPEKYGKTITIERTIYSTGSSNYKIRDQHNKVVSEKKEEVENITKHFQILVDNPVCVLTQEVSKNFLNSKNPKDKYKFFVKATQLEEVKLDYENASANKENSIRMLEEKRETIEIHKRKLEKARSDWNKVETVRNSVQKLNTLSQEALWANVNEKKDGVDKLTKKKDDADQKCESFDKKIEEINQQKEKNEQKKQEMAEKLQNLSADVEKSKVECEKVDQEADEADRKLAAKVREVDFLKSELNRKKMSISHLEKRIEGIEMENRQSHDINWEAEMEKTQSKMEELREQDCSCREKLNELAKQKDELVNSKIQIADDIRRSQAQLKSAKSEIERMNHSKKNHINRYGNNYSAIMSNIEADYCAGKFRKKPFGPIGEYIRLQDASAALAVEVCLGRNLYAFVVDNHHDSQVLQSIFNRTCGGSNRRNQPDIIVRAYAPLHDVSRNETRTPNHQNFLQLLNIKEPEVANCLIDHNSIERILYIPNYREAQNLLIRPETSPNCVRAYTSAGDQMYPATATSDYKCYANKNRKTARILVQDFTSLIENCQKSIEKFSQALKDAQERAREVEKQLELKKKEFNELEHTSSQYKEQYSQLEKKIDDLKEKFNTKPVEVIALKEEIQRYISERDALELELATKKEEKIQLKDNYTSINLRRDECHAKHNEIMNSRQPTKHKIDEICREITNLNKQLNSLAQKKDEQARVCAEIQAELEKQRESFEAARQHALAITGTEIKTEKKYKTIEKEIQYVKETVAANQQMTKIENQEKALKEFRDQEEIVKRLVEEVKELDDYIRLLATSIEERKLSFHHLRFYITRVVNLFFSNVLRQKEFTGAITPYFCETIDDDGKVKKAETLEVIIYPRNKEQFIAGGNSQSADSASSMYSSTKSLSGGERSFSTVAFIIALWQICPSPFRLLDEVDVFMDMVTRKISIDTLIWFATERSSKQFIFLSPLKMQQIENPECVTINYMPEIIRK